MIGAFAITFNEEEQVRFMLECFERLADQLEILSIIDNGSTDCTMDIIDSFRHRIPMKIRTIRDTPHHGQLRTAAMEGLTAPWIFYLDADETFTSDFPEWLRSDEKERGDIVGLYKYSTIIDRYHYTIGGGGPSLRLFRNLPGVHFPQSIHTEPIAQGLTRRVDFNNGPYLFDATATKSREALQAKGTRYAWANREGVPAVGGVDEYTVRVDDAFSKNAIAEFDDRMKALIFTGP